MKLTRGPSEARTGDTIGSYSHSRANVPGRRSSAMSRAVPPMECPAPTRRPAGTPSSSTTASTSSAMPSQPKSMEAGDVLSPWPRKSSAQAWAASASAAAIGAQVMPRNPVGWQNSTGTPSPPRSWSATVTPPDDGTRRADPGGGTGEGETQGIRPCWQRFGSTTQTATGRR